MNSMQHHNHMHKNLHSAMYAVWRKKNPAQETGDKSNADSKMQRSSQAILWQFKNPHIPREKLAEHTATIESTPLAVVHGEKLHYYAHKPYIFKINLF